jgi:predicted O-methyltransferase YrrM
VDERTRERARDAIGFMPEPEGLALYEAGLVGGKVGPLLEIGSYCGKSALYLGAAARERSTLLYSVDHHRGSEEHQPGEEYHDARLVDQVTGSIDTLPWFRRTIASAGLEDVVVGILADSTTAARGWGTSLGLVFIDGGHSEEAARADYEMWSPHVLPGGVLAIHDVKDSPDWGAAPLLVYRQALGSGAFKEIVREGSLRVLVRS